MTSELDVPEALEPLEVSESSELMMGLNVGINVGVDMRVDVGIDVGVGGEALDPVPDSVCTLCIGWLDRLVGGGRI